MKKLFFLAGFYCLYATGYAKNASGERKNVSAVEKVNHDRPTGYVRAQQHFSEAYPNVENPSWITLSDKGFQCTFRTPGKVRRVHYDKYGNWLFTISGYEASDLTKDVKDALLEKYAGYQIDYINEVTSDAQPIYFVNIEDDKYIKVIKYFNGNSEVQRVMEKTRPYKTPFSKA
jgi:hypothetical protein